MFREFKHVYNFAWRAGNGCRIVAWIAVGIRVLDKTNRLGLFNRMHCIEIACRISKQWCCVSSSTYATSLGALGTGAGSSPGLEYDCVVVELC